MPDTRVGVTFDHEFAGVVEEVGSAVDDLQIGDRVLVPFNIACGQCHFCKQGLFGNRHESNAQSNLLHWMLLLAADRINVAEGVLADTRHGRIPNLAAQMGGRAEWKHNKQGLAVKIAVGAAVLGLGPCSSRAGGRKASLGC